MATVRLLAIAPEDDATLVARARSGDARAFADLYRRHVRYVAGTVYSVLRSNSDVDDVTQHAFTAAHRQLRELLDGGSFRVWVARIAMRRAYRLLNTRRRQKWLSDALVHFAPRASNPLERHDVDALYEVLDRISASLRIPWVLHTIEGATFPEVAEMCAISLNTARNRVAQAEEQIRRRLHAK